MTQVSDTKKCPFCAYDGAKVERYSLVPPPTTAFEYRVTCLNCGACGPNELNKKQAIWGWNMRREVHPSVQAQQADDNVVDDIVTTVRFTTIPPRFLKKIANGHRP